MMEVLCEIQVGNNGIDVGHKVSGDTPERLHANPRGIDSYLRRDRFL
jgi:hypothetical protein